jgi:hypothetical protein
MRHALKKNGEEKGGEGRGGAEGMKGWRERGLGT